jgi:hypothetical protein
MRVSVPHSREKADVVRILGKPLSVLFAGAVDGLVIADERREWNNSTMSFSCVGKVGFISLPLSGSMYVFERVLAVEIELPAAVKLLIGEEKVRAGLAEELSALLQKH